MTNLILLISTFVLKLLPLECIFWPIENNYSDKNKYGTNFLLESLHESEQFCWNFAKNLNNVRLIGMRSG